MADCQSLKHYSVSPVDIEGTFTKQLGSALYCGILRYLAN